MRAARKLQAELWFWRVMACGIAVGVVSGVIGIVREPGVGSTIFLLFELLGLWAATDAISKASRAGAKP